MGPQEKQEEIGRRSAVSLALIHSTHREPVLSESELREVRRMLKMFSETCNRCPIARYVSGEDEP